MSQSAGGGKVLPPREAARWIAETSKDVTICQDGIRKTAELVRSGISNGNLN